MNIDIKKILYFILISHLILWTAIPTIFNQNLPLDTIEGLVWGNELKLGYDKYPPIFPLFTELFYKFFWKSRLGILFIKSTIRYFKFYSCL